VCPVGSNIYKDNKISHSDKIFRHGDYGNVFGHPSACKAIADERVVSCDFSEFDLRMISVGR